MLSNLAETLGFAALAAAAWITWGTPAGLAAAGVALIVLANDPRSIFARRKPKTRRRIVIPGGALTNAKVDELAPDMALTNGHIDES